MSRASEARARVARLRSFPARLLRALEGQRGTLLVVLVVALDLSLMLAVEYGERGKEELFLTGVSVKAASGTVSYGCSAFFIVDIAVRFWCFVLIQPPSQRATYRASIANNVRFFEHDRMRRKCVCCRACRRSREQMAIDFGFSRLISGCAPFVLSFLLDYLSIRLID